MRFLFVLVVISGWHPIASSDVAGTEPDRPAKVLLLSGQNNHAWQQTTPKIRSLLEATGRFRVDVDERPDRLTGERLAAYDVIVSNWNSWGKGDDRIVDWPPSTKKAYIDFVRAGGGHVVVHAGSSSFPEWDKYLELTLATWKLGQTGHGPRHEFSVRIDATDHPITQGMAPFKIHGELWHRAGVRPDVTVLASAFSAKEKGGSDRDEPIAMVNQIGQGRSFTLLLGHGVDEMDNPGFAALLVRGTEWAATGNVTEAIRTKSKFEVCQVGRIANPSTDRSAPVSSLINPKRKRGTNLRYCPSLTLRVSVWRRFDEQLALSN